MSGTRFYDFISGIESDTAPSASTPTSADDVMTKGYADGHYEAITPTIQGTGTYSSPQAITNGAALPFSSSVRRNLWYVTGSGGAIALGTSVQIAAPSFIGQELDIFGGSDTNTVSMADGNGLILNGATRVLAKDIVIRLMGVNVSGTLKWLEVGGNA